MTAGFEEPGLYGALFATERAAAAFSGPALARAMLRVEAALAGAQAELGLVPAAAASAIAEAADALEPDLGALGRGSDATGVPVIALVASLRAAVGPEHGRFVHWGATSQDILDTGVVLQLRDALDAMAGTLDAVIGALAEQAEAHRATPMVGRTRSQQAVPVTFGLKAAGWMMPYVRHRERLAELRPRALALQLGGAAGTLAAMGEAGPEVAQALAEALALTLPALPWHTQRDGLVELAGWLALVGDAGGKLGQDVMLLAQSEVGEVRESADAGRGGSSTMPQKSNPVTAEALVTLATLNAGLLGSMHQAARQEHERGGPGWQLEWIVLPRMVAAADASLAHALALARGMVVDAGRMRANLEASRGLVLAEAASFALATHMPRPEAQALVKAACAACAADGRHLLEALAERTDAPVDWAALADPTAATGAAVALVDAALRSARRRPAP